MSKVTVDEISEYDSFIEKASKIIAEYQENFSLELNDVETIFKNLNLEFKDLYCKLERDVDQQIQDILQDGTVEEFKSEYSTEEGLQFLKRAFYIQVFRKNELEILWEAFSGERQSEITKETMADALKELPKVPLTEDNLNDMIQMIGGFPASRLSFESLLVESGFLDQRIKLIERANRPKRKRKRIE